MMLVICFFFQAEDGIRDVAVTGVQTCALPIFTVERRVRRKAVCRSGSRTLWMKGIEIFPCPEDCEEFFKRVIPFRWSMRSEERRVGKECRSRWSPYH